VFRPARKVSLLALALAFSGCHTWQSVSRAPTSAVWRDLPDEIRLTLEDGRSLTLERPVIRLDQTIQSESGGPSAALRDISSVEARRLSTVRTAGLVLAKASILFQVIAVIVAVQPHYHGLF
jgi:hypothetical protein